MLYKIFPGNYKSLEKISEFIKNTAKTAGFDDFTIFTIETSVDEACSNIIEHAYGEEGIGNIEITIDDSEKKFTVILRDHGDPFNPESIPDPKLSSNINEREEHGLGLYMMKQWMDDVIFEFKDNSNVLTLIKNKGS